MLVIQFPPNQTLNSEGTFAMDSGFWGKAEGPAVQVSERQGPRK